MAPPLLSNVVLWLAAALKIMQAAGNVPGVRFVRIVGSAANPNGMSFEEVQPLNVAGTNLALGKSANCSLSYTPSGYINDLGYQARWAAGKAVDGFFSNGDGNHEPFILAPGQGVNGWWEVDFGAGAGFDVAELKLYPSACSDGGNVGTTIMLLDSARNNLWASAPLSNPVCQTLPVSIYTNSLYTNSFRYNCSSPGYSYNGNKSFACCAVGASLLSASLGCRPPALLAGPTDTAFYLSGSSAEGVTAFSTINAPSGMSFQTSVPVADSRMSALSFARGSFLAATGAEAPATLPSGGNVAWSASAWVKCAAPALIPPGLSPVTTLTPNVPGCWGIEIIPSTSSVGGLIVASESRAQILLVNFEGVVSVLAGAANSHSFNDGFATNARFSHPRGVTVLMDGNYMVADSDNYRLRIVTPAGAVSTFAGSGARQFLDGTGTNAKFCQVYALAAVPSSTSTGTQTIVLIDTDCNSVRLVTYPGAVVSTIAGQRSGATGYADGTGTNAKFFNPLGVVVLTSFNVFIVAECVRSLQHDRGFLRDFLLFVPFPRICQSR
jgi:hypothetical protein